MSLQDRISKSLTGIPGNLKEVNPQAWVQIELKVAYNMTQLRGSIKKALKKDSTLDPGAQMKIATLTKVLVGRGVTESELHEFGVETFMRVALFRKVYQKNPGDNFWNAVDELLKVMLKAGKAKYESTHRQGNDWSPYRRLRNVWGGTAGVVA